MKILTVLFVLSALFWYGVVKWDGWRDEGKQFICGISATLSTVLFIIALIAVPIARDNCRDSVASIKAFQYTVTNERMTGDKLEGATFRLKIADTNTEIASLKYQRHGMWSFWTDPSIDTLELIK